jgi:DNA-binding XRE family transcriptional regulator
VTTKRIDRIPKVYRERVKKQLDQLSLLIQKKRKSENLTQEALAEDLDIDPQTLAYIEQKRRYPSLPLLFALCTRLEIQIQFK